MTRAVLLCAARIATLLGMGAAGAVHGAGGVVSGASALDARAAIDVAIRVPAVLELRALGQPDSLEITPADLEAGRITVRGSRLQLVSNDPRGTTLRAELRNAAFRSVRIDGLVAAAPAPDAHFSVTLPSMVGRPRPVPFEVAYELELQPDAMPGRYAWPVALSLETP
jgi:hypothetical protein